MSSVKTTESQVKPKPSIRKNPEERPFPEEEPPEKNPPLEAPTDPETEKKKEIKFDRELVNCFRVSYNT